MSEFSILITGADGYVGSRLVGALLEKETAPIIAWVRAANEKELESKKEKLAKLIGESALSNPKLSVACGNLTDEDPFANVDSNTIGKIIHSASVTRFNVEEDIAKNVNLEGTRRVLEFAKKCENLSKILYLSSVYASGKRVGEIAEKPLSDEAGFANFYEWSKWESEQLILKEYSDLPWTIVRIATIIADNDEGKVTQYNVVHNTLKLLYYGLISLVPGDGDVPLYFVTGDYVCDGVCQLSADSVPNHQVFHLVHREEETLVLSQLLDLVHETFEKDEDFSKRQVLKPLLVDEDGFNLLAGQMDNFSGGVVQQAMKSIEPFAKQMFLKKSFAINSTVEQLSEYQAPVPTELIRKTAKTLAETKWGRKC